MKSARETKMEAAKCSLPSHSPMILAYVGNRFTLSRAARKKQLGKYAKQSSVYVYLWSTYVRVCTCVWRPEIASGIVLKVASTF